MSIFVVSLGCWIIIDGAGSIIIYSKQRWYEHLVRIVRIVIGSALVVVGGMF
jgi:hypothetical protein